MTNTNEFFDGLIDDEKLIFLSFCSFPDFFSVDWFSELPPSKLITLISEIEKQQWISPMPGDRGYYIWSPTFPRQELTSQIPPEEMSQHHRSAVERLSKLSPRDHKTALALAQQCQLAGLLEEDLNFIAEAARIEESNNRIFSASNLYEAILCFIEKLIIEDKEFSESTWNSFIHSVERRASLSLFELSLENEERFLTIALEHAIKRGGLKTQANIEFLIGQNHWMHFQHEQACEHFSRGLEIIKKIDNEKLYRSGLKIQGLIYACKGQYFEAIKTYENSLGELELFENRDFFLVAALNMALCYTEVGMPQRGLGISESIQKHCMKNENLPLLTVAFATAGMIFLHIRSLKESQTNFEKAAELASKEKLLTMEALANIGLANIYCIQGNYERAIRHFSVLWNIKQSNWYNFLNFTPLMEVFFMLRSKVPSDDLECFFDFINNINQDEVNPFIYASAKRLLVTSPESKSSYTEKIQTLLSLEESIETIGESIESSLIRIELARLYMQENETQRAQDYAIKAWKFLNYKAKIRFPLDLYQLLPKENQEAENTILELVIEIAQALVYQENSEQLFTNFITAIAQIGGAERTGLFIREKNSSNVKMIASRNLFPEDLEDESFQKSMELIKAAASSDSDQFLQYEFVGKKRVLLSPIKLSNKVIGVLYKEGRFLNVDIDREADNARYIPILSSQIALSLERVLANDEITQLNKKLLSENLYYIETMEEIRPFRDIVGSSKAIMNVQTQIQKVAPTLSTVLIHGETGVGKELVARAIHRESSRKNGPFIRVNCAALPDTLIDSELFGHEKGAFTGATHAKEGRFELANNGTIFMDEISELPLSTQSRLLRILQEKEFQRVGGTKTRYSNFRLIAATNKDLAEAVENGKFRADLFYRLNVFPIQVPPLRERKEDIPQLVAHFLKFHCTQNSKEYMGISNSEMEKLKAYSWPGNIRELSNTIELAVIMGGSKINFPDLKTDNGNGNGNNIKQNQILKLNLKEGERLRILEALEKSGGKIGGSDGAAALVGLNRTTLIHRMKKLGIKIENRQTIIYEKVN